MSLSLHKNFLTKLFFILAGLACLFTRLPADIALILGIALALTLGNPFLSQTRKATKQLLSLSIIGLGAGMSLTTIAAAGLNGIGYTALGIGFALLAGRLIGKVCKTDNDTSWLICVGTAICGGSAIAAIAPVIRAKDHHISIALGVVFILNAVALVLFPWVGHWLNMSQAQFGLWSALAIHDTSSVVGAGMQYGPEALEVGTTVKLVRALWIIPLAFIFAFAYHRHANTKDEAAAIKPKYPWFILGFLVMAAIATWVPQTAAAMDIIAFCAKRLLVLTLFLIGSTLTMTALRSAGPAPMIQGLLLWTAVSTLSFLAITTGFITP